MGSSVNRLRKKWQHFIELNAGLAEKDFKSVFSFYLKILNTQLLKAQKSLVKCTLMQS